MTVWDKDALSAPHSERELGQIEADGFITIRDSWPTPDEADAPVSAVPAVGVAAELIGLREVERLIEELAMGRGNLPPHENSLHRGRQEGEQAGYAHVLEIVRAALRAQQPASVQAEPTDAQVIDACTWYRHDFGLAEPDVRDATMNRAREWLRAWQRALPAAAPGSGRAIPAAQVTGGVQVKPLEWVEGWGGSFEDVPRWDARSPTGLSFGFAAVGLGYKAHADAPAEWVAAEKSRLDGIHEARIRAALTGGAQ